MTLPPVMRVLTRWSLVSREDTWLLLAPYITRQQLDTFEEVAIAVLGEKTIRSMNCHRMSVGMQRCVISCHSTPLSYVQVSPKR